MLKVLSECCWSTLARSSGAVLLLLLAGVHPSALAQDVNLLSLDRTTLNDAGFQLFNEKHIRDDDAKTATKVTVSAQPIDLVYEFDDVVTVRELSIASSRLSAGQVSVEVLATTVSPLSGHRSLRVEPLRASGKFPQKFSFEPTAARWIIVRFSITNQDVDEIAFSIAELAIRGHLGEPESVYQFDESPADAIQVLAQLPGSISIDLSEDEQRLFEDAKDGKFDDLSFAEASLLSSGVRNQQERARLLQRIDQLESECRSKVAADLSAFERGKRLLDWLHAGPLRNGYVEQQTDVSVVLKGQTFNCVSSATLYNILARRMGLDARGIEVPDHAFSILYDCTKHVDVETTNRLGFNPARNRKSIEQLRRTTGFVYIPESNRSKRREVGDVGMVAITYYNHGVTKLKKKSYRDALLSFFKALSLDANNKSAVKNVLATLGNWSGQLYDEGNAEKAIAVLEVGRDLAPQDRRLKHNQKAIWQRHLSKLVTEEKSEAAIAQLTAAFERTENPELLKLQSFVVIQRGEGLATEKNWEAALEIADKGLAVIDESAQRDLKRWRTSVVLRWTRGLLDNQEFEGAVDVIERGKSVGANYLLDQRLAFIAQEWARKVKEAGGNAAGHELMSKLMVRFPKNSRLRRVFENYTDRAAREFLDEKNYEEALKVYAAARKLNPTNMHLRQNEDAVWGMMAEPFIKARAWKDAVDVYERAYKSDSRNHSRMQNLAFVIQEFAKDTAKKDGVGAGEDIIRKLAARFPKVSKVQALRGKQIGKEVSRLVTAKQFDDAHELLSKHQKAWPSNYKFGKIATYVYYQQAKTDLDEKNWDNAIGFLEKGYRAFPEVSGLRTNLEFCWNSKAKEFMDKEQWDKAIEVYEQALEAIPGNFKFKNNLRYCKSKAE